MKTLVLIDSNAVIHRAYHALPKNLSNAKGELTNVTYGFALALIRILEELHPEYIAAAFDLAAPTFRHKEYKEYKATRVKADQELYNQIPRVREMLAAFGVPMFAVEGFEADDILGTIAWKFANDNKDRYVFPAKIEDTASLEKQEMDPGSQAAVRDDGGRGEELTVYIASGDRDVYQLLDGNIKVLMLKKGFSEAEIFDRTHLKEVYSLEPEDFIDLKALMGDTSDNIPGVPGIGPKTATNLLLKFDTLQGIYDAIESKNDKMEIASNKVISNEVRNPAAVADDGILTSPSKAGSPQDDTLEQVAKELGIKSRILKLLIEYKDQAFQSKMLATIRKDVPIDFDLEQARWGQFDAEKLRTLFEELEFKSLLVRFSKGFAEQESEKKVTKEQKKKDDQLRLEL